MTTVAACGQWIVADGLLNNNGSRQITHAKKIRVEDGVIYALAGTTGLFEPLIQWHKKGADPGNLPKGIDLDWCLMTITREDGLLFYTSRLAYPEKHVYPWTMGTGNEYAMGAMKAGASAEEAVRIACEIDIHSGGEIQVVNIREALGMTPRLVEAG